MTTAKWILWFGLCASLTLLGCPDGDDDDDSAISDDDDSAGGGQSDDDTGDDDSAGDDDDSAGDDDTGDDDAVDDNTCDEGATADTELGFEVQNYYGPVTDADYCFTDVDAATGALLDELAAGNLGATTALAVTLDCANGWVKLDLEHPDNVSYHLYMRVLPTSDWPIVLMPADLAEYIVGMAIGDPASGVLEVYHIGPTGESDTQAEDSLTIDGGDNLIPAGAADDVGLQIWDGATEGEDYDIWTVNAAMPGNGDVVEVRYHDASEDRVWLFNGPVHSWEDGAGNHITAVAFVG